MYDDAGVSIERGADVVERLSAPPSPPAQRLRRVRRLASARRPAAAGRVHGLGGSKLILARERGALRNCGADLAAHCINDVILWADPLVLLDYVAANIIHPRSGRRARGGAAEVSGCRRRLDRRGDGRAAGHLPGGRARLCRTCMGVVDPERVIDGSAGHRRRRRRGLPSAGVHANGFTLVRRVLEDEDYDGLDLARSHAALPRRRPPPS